ncbi:uncharacterized protein IWZ02DRAFT_268968 [Phyllosticta citriasiana]|uniref:uncharacterized protein n=1 Tax=Phyllosticta citriasiana TaxID=595635 RepID=UPI0030FDEB0B
MFFWLGWRQTGWLVFVCVLLFVHFSSLLFSSLGGRTALSHTHTHTHTLLRVSIARSLPCCCTYTHVSFSFVYSSSSPSSPLARRQLAGNGWTDGRTTQSCMHGLAAGLIPISDFVARNRVLCFLSPFRARWQSVEKETKINCLIEHR